METNINDITKFEDFLKKFDFFEHAKVDEDSIKLNNCEFEMTLFYPLEDTAANNKVYSKFLCFTMEEHAYINVHFKFYDIKKSEIFLNKDEHEESLYVQTALVDTKENLVKFVFEHEDGKHIQIEYGKFSVEINYDKNEKVFAHKRLKFRLFE